MLYPLSLLLKGRPWEGKERPWMHSSDLLSPLPLPLPGNHLSSPSSNGLVRSPFSLPPSRVPSIQSILPKGDGLVFPFPFPPVPPVIYAFPGVLRCHFCGLISLLIVLSINFLTKLEPFGNYITSHLDNKKKA